MTKGWLKGCWRFCLAGSLALIEVAIAFGDGAKAQVSADPSLGTTVTVNGATFEVTNGTSVGNNLFHSFSNFSVPSGEAAYFLNAPDITNILARVTGASVSDIQGLIRANGTANLFLINPNGIVFGQNAQLDIGGSFVATTANAVQFPGGGEFSINSPVNPGNSLLSVNPSALLFNQIANKPIENNSIAPAGVSPSGITEIGLRVPNGKSLLLVGGDITMNGGRLNALGGRVELGGLPGQGTVGLTINGDSFSLNFAPNSALANITLANDARVSVRGAGGGDIVGNANTFTATDGGRLTAGTEGLGNAGNITVNANQVNLSGVGATSEVGAGFYNQVIPNGSGNGGNIFVNANVMNMASNAVINSTILPEGAGNGGNVDIKAETISLTDSALIDTSAYGQGNAGSVFIQASGAVSLVNSNIYSNIDTGAVGNGGDININADSLLLSNGSQLQASINRAFDTLPGGQGDAGSVNINVRNAVTISGKNQDGFPSAIFSSVGTGGTGNGGDINITAETLFLTDGTFITASTSGKGDAGDISITTGSLSFSNGGRLSSTTSGQGNAGDVIVTARDTISLDGEDNNGFVSSITSGVLTGAVGEGGDITITTGSLSLTNGADLFASTDGQGNAGKVTITARDTISFDGEGSNGIGSGISSTVGQNAVGEGGNITLATGSLSLTNGANLFASTFGRGNAGKVTITARDTVSFDGEGSGISSGVGFDAVGNGGDVTITTGSFFLTNGATLFVPTAGRGNAGKISITARDTVSFKGVDTNSPIASIFSNVGSRAVGNGGDINIKARSLSLTNTAIFAATAGEGDAGSVFFQVDDAVSLINSDISSNTSEQSTGKSGDISIQAGLLSLDGGLGLSAVTFGQGDAGNIDVNVGSLSVTNSAGLSTFTSGQGNAGNTTISATNTVSFDRQGGALSFSSGTGSGGDIKVTAEQLFLTNGGQLNAISSGQGDAGNIDINVGSLSVTNGPGLATFTSGQGDAGNITIAATNTASFDNGFAFSASAGAGRGGDINVAAGELVLTNGGELNAVSLAQGEAGNISVNVRNTLQANNGNILTTALQSSGGAIDITAADIRLRGDSNIITSVLGGAGGGGNITLTADSIIALDDSDILAFARDGSGGNVTFNTPAFFGENYEPAPQGTDPVTLDGNNRVDINASGAVAGIITLPDVSFIQNSLTELPENLIDTNTVIANSCIARSGETGSSFTIAGADGLPNRPGDASTSPYPTGTVRSVKDTTASRPWKIGDPIVEPQGVYRLPSGELVMSRECSQQ